MLSVIEIVSVVMVCAAVLTMSYVVAELIMYDWKGMGNSDDDEYVKAYVAELLPADSMSLEDRNALNQAFFDCYVDAMQTRDWINRAINRDDMHIYQQKLLNQERAHIESLLEQINSDNTDYDEESLEAARRTQHSIYNSVSTIMGTKHPC